MSQHDNRAQSVADGGGYAGYDAGGGLRHYQCSIPIEGTYSSGRSSLILTEHCPSGITDDVGLCQPSSITCTGAFRTGLISRMQRRPHGLRINAAE